MKNIEIFPFERNKYYYGKLLSVEDFNLEQKYINDKRRMINRFVLGTGVVAGMYVVSVDERTISLEKGVALDSLGREIVVDAPVIKKLSLIDGFDACVKSENDRYMYLCAEYSEAEKGPVHNVAGTDASGDNFNKIRESYHLFLTNEEPENDFLAPSDLYEQRKTVYWDGTVCIRQIMPRYVQAGEEFELRIEVENLDKQYLAFSYNLMLTCLESSDKQSVLKVSFDEILFEKTGNYTLRYKLEALQRLNVEGIAVIDPKSFQLTLGRVPQVAQAEEKSVTFITDKDARRQVIAGYYRSAADDFFKKNNNQHLYLAKIYLVKAGDTSLIEKIENVPFGQYVMNNFLSAATQQLMAQNNITTTDKSLVNRDAVSKAEKNGHDIASGTCRINFGAGGQKKERFYSDEIVHGLGLGSVTIILSVSGVNSVIFGSMDVFEHTNPVAKLAASLNPSKGTFIIGVQLLAATTKSSIDVKWTAIRDVEEVIEEKSKMKIFIKPNALTLKTRESYYLEAICSNMQDKTIHWSAAHNGGMIDNNGLYVAPNVAGVYEVVAQSAAYPDVKASILIVVRD